MIGLGSDKKNKQNNLSAGQTFASAVASRDDQHLMKQELQTKEIVDPRNNGREMKTLVSATR